ncbi:hypothetical protein BAE44_0024709 [Dichanthelium oligosanthes]|uniref:Uncharacterized protein n=1 Tax=Dichanthelium oligosanthes TaxID=888268 RepID=A0A1E5UN32_9POAL|nr:hypothetical protein BAE44_0024709 [Dichanthelium oligosanthes]
MPRNKATRGRTWRVRRLRRLTDSFATMWELSFAEAKTQNPDHVCGECYVCPAFSWD